MRVRAAPPLPRSSVLVVDPAKVEDEPRVAYDHDARACSHSQLSEIKLVERAYIGSK